MVHKATVIHMLVSSLQHHGCVSLVILLHILLLLNLLVLVHLDVVLLHQGASSRDTVLVRIDIQMLLGTRGGAIVSRLHLGRHGTHGEQLRPSILILARLGIALCKIGVLTFVGVLHILYRKSIIQI